MIAFGFKISNDHCDRFAHDATAIDSLAGVIKSNREQRRSAAEALSNSGVDKYDIPAFLRRQAD